MVVLCFHNNPELQPLELDCQGSPWTRRLFDVAQDELCLR
jgi:hypothetical protein